MPYIYVPFWVEEEILDGLKSGKFERKGGVIRNTDNKRIVCWLKQEGEIPKDTHVSHTLFKIIAGSADVESLTNEELMDLGKFINGNENLASFNFYQGCIGPVGAITGKYERLLEKADLESAKDYASDKRQSLVNIFARTYIPNLKHQVELKMITMVRDEKKGLVEFVKNVD